MYIYICIYCIPAFLLSPLSFLKKPGSLVRLPGVVGLVA